MHKKIVALVGRPNVGKSTLFNRLSTQKRAIVHDEPGVTRDRKYTEGRLSDLEFILIDTPGLEEAKSGELQQRMMLQTLEAIKEADLVCLMVDAKVGITPADEFFAGLIRKHTDNYLLIANKCEGGFVPDSRYYKLGFADIAPVSAEHGLGLAELYDGLANTLTSHRKRHTKLDSVSQETLKQSPGDVQDDTKEKAIQIVVAGRPNAGKSTFINTIIGTQRVLTGPEAGITRESIEIDWIYRNHKLKLIDTAGLRRKSLISEKLEKISTYDTIESLKFANIVILMLDALTPLHKQDLNIAAYVIKEGRALVIAVNKWDLIKDRQGFQEEFEYKLSTHLSQVKDIPVTFISALNKANIDALLDNCIKIYELWNRRISTGKLNEWLNFATQTHPLPLQKQGKRIRLKYMTQIKSRPPTFKIFANHPENINDSYKQYLLNSMRENFDLPGVPIRFIFSKTDNPYAKK